jgi:hypothetical protein
MVTVFSPVSSNDLYGAVIPLQRKLEPDDIVAGPDLMKHPAVVIGLYRGLVEHLVYLPKKASFRLGLGVRLGG